MELCQSDTPIPSFRPKPGAVLPVQLQHQQAHSVNGKSRNGNGNWRQGHYTVTPTPSFRPKLGALSASITPALEGPSWEWENLEQERHWELGTAPGMETGDGVTLL